MDRTSIEATRRRTERYWYEDGIWELGFGLINLLLAGYFALAQWVLANRLPAPLLVLLQLVTLVGIFLLMGRVMRLMKERITYPRTGYVAYRRAPLKARARRMLLIGLLSGGIAAGLAVASASRATRDLTPLISSVVMSATVIYIGYRFNLLRMYALAALTLALGALVPLLPLDETSGRVLFFAGYGLLFLVSGGLILAGYLRRTQPPGETADYEAPASLEED